MKENNNVTQKEFSENMEKKISDQDFLGDMEGLLWCDLSFKITEAYKFLKANSLEKI